MESRNKLRETASSSSPPTSVSWRARQRRAPHSSKYLSVRRGSSNVSSDRAPLPTRQNSCLPAFQALLIRGHDAQQEVVVVLGRIAVAKDDVHTTSRSYVSLILDSSSVSCAKVLPSKTSTDSQHPSPSISWHLWAIRSLPPVWLPKTTSTRLHRRRSHRCSCNQRVCLWTCRCCRSPSEVVPNRSERCQMRFSYISLAHLCTCSIPIGK